MASNDISPILITLVDNYLCARGSPSMAEVVPPVFDVKSALFMKYQYILGWQNSIEGRFLLYIVHLQQEYLSNQDTSHTAKTWTHGMIKQLLRITHLQWLLQNTIIHYRLLDGRTYAKHKKLVEKVLFSCGQTLMNFYQRIDCWLTNTLTSWGTWIPITGLIGLLRSRLLSEQHIISMATWVLSDTTA
jgi:hypothetical protein